jgi:hypothetical protein
MTSTVKTADMACEWGEYLEITKKNFQHYLVIRVARGDMIIFIKLENDNDVVIPDLKCSSRLLFKNVIRRAETS